MLGMLHTKAVVVVPSCSIIVHPETSVKTESLLWECDPVIPGMTVSSPSSSMEFIPTSKLMHISKSVPRTRQCRKRLLWVREDAPVLGLPILGTKHHQALLRGSSWGWASSTPSSSSPSQFFGVWSPRGAFPRLFPLWRWGAGTFSQNFPNSLHVPAIKQWLCECGLGDVADEFGRQIPGSSRHCGSVFLSRGAGGVWRKQPSLVWSVWHNL